MSTVRLRLAWVAAGIGVLLVLYALFSRKSDEERIVDQLDRLQALLSFSAPPNVLQRAATLKGGFQELLTQDARVRIPERGLQAQGRPELAALATRATASLQSFDVVFDVDSIHVDGNAAHVEATVSVEGASAGEPRSDQRRAKLEFVESDGDWLLATALVEPLDDNEP